MIVWTFLSKEYEDTFLLLNMRYTVRALVYFFSK